MSPNKMESSTLQNFNDSDTTIFVYGTLTDSKTRLSIIGRDVRTAKASIHGYDSVQILIDGIMYPAAIPEKTKTIHGMVLLHLTPKEIKILDEYEGECYDRIKVILKNGSKAWLYVWNGK